MADPVETRAPERIWAWGLAQEDRGGSLRYALLALYSGQRTSGGRVQR